LKRQFIVCFEGPNTVCRTLCVFNNQGVLGGPTDVFKIVPLKQNRLKPTAINVRIGRIHPFHPRDWSIDRTEVIVCHRQIGNPV